MLVEYEDLADPFNENSRIHFPCIYHYCHVELVCGDHYEPAAVVEPLGYLRVSLPDLLPY